LTKKHEKPTNQVFTFGDYCGLSGFSGSQGIIHGTAVIDKVGQTMEDAMLPTRLLLLGLLLGMLIEQRT
jgi:hypothetical protein